MNRCPECESDNLLEDEFVLTCVDCGHEWERDDG